MAVTAAQARSRQEAAFVHQMKQQVAETENRQFAEMYVEACRRQVFENDRVLFDFIKCLDRPPVGIEEFLDSKEFLGSSDLVVWPEVRKAIVDININWWRGPAEAYNEAILAGATGTGKSTIMIVTTLYHVYLLSCISKPQQIYGLPSATPIVFPIMGAKPQVVSKVVYMPMRKLLEGMPYFQKHMMPDKNIDSEMFFKEKNIRVVKANGDEDSILGEATIGGDIDEINFMQVVQKSKKAEAGTGRSGLYDQAQTIHQRLVTRKKGRFTYKGPMIGIVFASSSTRYKGDFTDRRMKFIRDNNITTTYIYNKKQYDVAPASRYSGEKFRLLIGNEVTPDTRVLEPGEQVTPGAWVEEVPIEYIEDFRSDPYTSLRDILGISNNSLSPFFKMRYRILEAVELGNAVALTSMLEKDHVILGLEGMPRVLHGHYCFSPGKSRYVHIDLSETGDRCGIAMVRFDGLVRVTRSGGQSEWLPTATVELACTIQPDVNNEIDIAEVRSFVRSLKTAHGYPIKGVTYDGFDSRESIQQWRKDGMPSKKISVDRTSVPYKQLRDAIYDGRLTLPDNDLMVQEFMELEHDTDKDKVDHPITGSKDLADAICGAFSNMLDRRSTWEGMGVDPNDPYAGRAADGDRYDGARR